MVYSHRPSYHALLGYLFTIQRSVRKVYCYRWPNTYDLNRWCLLTLGRVRVQTHFKAFDGNFHPLIWGYVDEEDLTKLSLLICLIALKRSRTSINLIL